jgi:mRNA interferase RelE/StbE
VRYRIEWLAAAVRDVKALPRDVQRRVADRIDLLAYEPRPADAKALPGAASGLLRTRIGDHRVVYRVRDAELIVLVVMAAHRSEVYRRLQRRRRDDASAGVVRASPGLPAPRTPEPQRPRAG